MIFVQFRYYFSIFEFFIFVKVNIGRARRIYFTLTMTIEFVLRFYIQNVSIFHKHELIFITRENKYADCRNVQCFDGTLTD